MRNIEQLEFAVSMKIGNAKLKAATERRMARQKFLSDICTKACKGKVAIVTGGRDCDGVRWEGQVALVDADVRTVEGFIDHLYEWADGPVHWYITSPIAAADIAYSSRDLTLEAFEDGHQHVIYD